MTTPTAPAGATSRERLRLAGCLRDHAQQLLKDGAIVSHLIADLKSAADLLSHAQSNPQAGEELEAWIEREFSGHGRAIRRKNEEPFPDEPYMSMADAKELTRRAVAMFVPATPAGNDVERVARALCCQYIDGGGYGEVDASMWHIFKEAARAAIAAMPARRSEGGET